VGRDVGQGTTVSDRRDQRQAGDQRRADDDRRTEDWRGSGTSGRWWALGRDDGQLTSVGLENVGQGISVGQVTTDRAGDQRGSGRRSRSWDKERTRRTDKDGGLSSGDRRVTRVVRKPSKKIRNPGSDWFAKTVRSRRSRSGSNQPCLSGAPEARLRTLSKENADGVACHLVAAYEFLETDPELAYEHAASSSRPGGSSRRRPRSCWDHRVPHWALRRGSAGTAHSASAQRFKRTPTRVGRL
jgi:23S rRNA pseudouridine2605 synthase